MERDPREFPWSFIMVRHGSRLCLLSRHHQTPSLRACSLMDFLPSRAWRDKFCSLCYLVWNSCSVIPGGLKSSGLKRQPMTSIFWGLCWSCPGDFNVQEILWIVDLEKQKPGSVVRWGLNNQLPSKPNARESFRAWGLLQLIFRAGCYVKITQNSKCRVWHFQWAKRGYRWQMFPCAFPSIFT